MMNQTSISNQDINNINGQCNKCKDIPKTQEGNNVLSKEVPQNKK